MLLYWLVLTFLIDGCPLVLKSTTGFETLEACTHAAAPMAYIKELRQIDCPAGLWQPDKDGR